MARQKNVKRKMIDGKRYFLLKEGVTKKEAVRSADWQRRGGFSARLLRVGRGSWQVWVRSE